MNKLDLTLDSVLSFVKTGIVYQEDGVTPMDISGWTIKGAVILQKDETSMDIPITGSFVTDGTDGQYKVSISDVNRDAIFTLYPIKSGLLYEIVATFTDGTGDILASGTLFLINSRPLSAK